MIEPFKLFVQRCVSVDLEVDPATATIFAFAAVGDGASSLIVAKKGDLVAALDLLEAELSGTSNGAQLPGASAIAMSAIGERMGRRK